MIIIDVNEIFLILGIEPTKDKKEIKKAYSNKVKVVHPEDNPNEWTRIYNAYKNAILWSETKEEELVAAISECESKEIKTEPSISKNEPKEEIKEEIKEVKIEPHVSEYEPKEENAKSEIKKHGSKEDKEANHSKFEDYLEIINLNKKELNESLEKLSLELEKISKNKVIIYFNWKQFFESDDYYKVCFHPDFIKLFNEKIQQIKIDRNTKELILSKLEVVWKTWEVSSYFSTEEKKLEKEKMIISIKENIEFACVLYGENIGTRRMLKIICIIISVVAIIGNWGNRIQEDSDNELNNQKALFQKQEELRSKVRMTDIIVENGIIIQSDKNILYEYLEENIPKELNISSENNELKIVSFSICTDDLQNEEYENKYATVIYTLQSGGQSDTAIYVFNGQSYVEAQLLDSTDANVFLESFGSYYQVNDDIFITVPIYEKGNTHPIVIVESIAKE